jgi:hypothetical protein
MALQIASESPGLTTTDPPGLTYSGIPPTLSAITGNPHDIASRIALFAVESSAVSRKQCALR